MTARDVGRVVLCLLLVSAAAAPLAAQDKVLLRHEFKAGEKFVGKMVTDQVLDMKQGNQSIKSEQSIRIETSMEVLSINEDGSAEVEYTYDRFAMKIDMPMMKMEYDSADPETDADNPMLAGFKALVGQSLQLKMGVRGEIMGVKGVDAIAERMVAAAPPEARALVRNQVKEMFTDEKLTQQLGGLSLEYPEKPVGKGDEWTTSQSMDMGFMKMDMKNVYKVKEVTADTVTLDLSTTVKPGAEPAAGAVTVDAIEGTQKGTMTIDRAKPICQSADITQDLTMKITAGGMAIQQHITSTVHTSVEPKKEETRP